jgi:membrane protease YdiL (CAAX protease family)
MGAGVAAVALTVTGTVAVGATWSLVRSHRVSLWAAMGTIFALLGLLSVLSGWVRLATRVHLIFATSVGLAAGLGLYAITAVFLALTRRWSRLRRDTRELYQRREAISLPASIAVAAAVVAPGEELFWRGLVQEAAIASTGSFLGAAVAWGLSLAANAASGSLPVVLGAAVGGVAWGSLAFWSGGVAASILCHASWTALMIARPPQ